MTYNVSLSVSREDHPDVELTANVRVDGEHVGDPLIAAMIHNLEKALNATLPVMRGADVR